MNDIEKAVFEWNCWTECLKDVIKRRELEVEEFKHISNLVDMVMKDELLRALHIAALKAHQDLEEHLATQPYQVGARVK
jgi:aromatic ring hydroxylase